MSFAPHTPARVVRVMLAVLVCLLPAAPSHARRQQQQAAPADDTSLGVAALERGDAKEAVKLLRRGVKQNKEDVKGWHYLGVAYAAARKEKDARKAFDRAADLRDEQFWKEYGAWREREGGGRTLGVREERREQFAADIEAAIASLERRTPPPKLADYLDDYLEGLRFYLALARETAPPILSRKEVTTKPVITFKPEPGFTEEARRDNITGLVRLRAVLGADGRVHEVLVLKGLPGGLTRKAIRAARGIRFTPATVDGKPVSQWVTLEYNFNVY